MWKVPMMYEVPASTLQIRTLITKSGKLELFLVDEPLKTPRPNQVVVRVEGTPINPSDLGLLISAADMSTAVQGGTPLRPTVTADVPQAAMSDIAGRLDQALRVGTEGAGTVVAAGESSAAQALLGHKVAVLGGGMYTQYRTIDASACTVLPRDTTAAQGAALFVNPLTALSFVETMRATGHSAIVHTAAASNLGLMLNRLCLADKIPLVNIVRRQQHVDMLQAMGAQHVVNSSLPTFFDDLVAALAETKATIGFDAIGGGPMAGLILLAMEAAASRAMDDYSRYGSGQETHVHIYGRLDTSPTTIPRSAGYSWNLSGYLMPRVVQNAGPSVSARMHARAARELHTTFASRYSETISLVDALDLETLKAYCAKSTGAKYLIDPSR